MINEQTLVEWDLCQVQACPWRLHTVCVGLKTLENLLLGVKEHTAHNSLCVLSVHGSVSLCPHRPFPKKHQVKCGFVTYKFWHYEVLCIFHHDHPVRLYKQHGTALTVLLVQYSNVSIAFDITCHSRVIDYNWLQYILHLSHFTLVCSAENNCDLDFYYMIWLLAQSIWSYVAAVTDIYQFHRLALVLAFHIRIQLKLEGMFPEDFSSQGKCTAVFPNIRIFQNFTWTNSM